ncbi:Sushi, nidogen and EGF-like domain-containing protein 1, partial [Zootermopsis nevadensis]
NPDIQDIITGIVKLLNGNVKVQANPNLPPGASRTRINNRGPPRITDVPPLPPDFDTSGPHPALSHRPPLLLPLQTSSRLPPPYPFDLPPAIVPLPPQPSEHHSHPDHPFMTGVPLPEQVVPAPNSNGNRPPANQGIVRPHRPRPPRPRPSTKPNMNNRRPQPIPLPDMDQLLPAYTPGANKNKQPEEGHDISITVTEDKDSKEHQYTTPQVPEEEIVTTTTASKSQPSPVDVPSNMNEEDQVSITTEETRDESEEDQANHTSDIEKPEFNSSTEEPKIIATLTSSSSTVNEATQDGFPSPPESTKKEDTVTLGGPSSGVPILEPSVGVGVATPVLESSMQEILMHDSTASIEWGGGSRVAGTATATPTSALPSSKSSLREETVSGISHAQDKLKQTAGGFPYYPYRSRTGIVLDDTEYKPMGVLHRPIITAPPAATGHVGDIFDITVTAVQGPGGANTGQPFIYPVEIDGVQLPGSAGSDVSVITKAEEGQHFVSIDGKRTYINLFGSSTEQEGVAPTKIQQGGHTPPPQESASTIGTGQVPHGGCRFAVLETEEPASHHGADQQPPRRPYNKRPSHPPVRIDMCTVGDDSTCDSAQNEMCRTELGVSSCHCRPGYSRRKHREPCRRVVSILMSLRVDRLYDRRVVWDGKLQNPESEEYKTLEWESSRAIDSAMQMTPFSDDFMGVRVNGLYTVPGGADIGGAKRGAVFVNLTLQLEETVETLRPAVRHDIQRHLLGVIHRRNNNVGHSALWVDSPPGSISHLQDVDECSSRELHDCHHQAHCSNVFGSFRCSCPEGYRDPWAGNPHRSGRQCETCSPEHCNSRGECRYEAGLPVCHCSGNFYGSQCEVDGEVLGVAVGASVAAVIIIVLTLVCLCMWSTVKTPTVGSPPYQVSLEDRLRWAQIADVIVQANHYAPEPVPGPTRPSSAMFGYPSLTMSGTLPHGAPPVPLPRLGLTNMSHAGAMSIHGGPTLSTLGALSNHGALSSYGMRTPDRTVESTSSEEEDRADLLGRNFHVPRPKSRSSVAVS